MEVARDRRQPVDHQEIIERVKRPSKETGGDSGVLVGGRDLLLIWRRHSHDCIEGLRAFTIDDMARLFAGTSGFSYPAWKPAFYPKDVPAKGFLQYYATRLNSVEINYTFRQLPSGKTLENWLAATSDDFAFSCIALLRLSHIMKMKDAGSFTE